MLSLVEKNPLQDLLSSLNAVISTNESTQFITGHVIYNPAYTYKFQLKTTKDKRGRQLESYKLAWASFCKLSYHDQSNPPTREMYIDFFEQKLEEGRSSISIYNTYIALKKVALYVYGQKIQNMPQVRKLVPRNPGYTKKEPTKRGNDVGNYYWPIVTGYFE